MITHSDEIVPPPSAAFPSGAVLCVSRKKLPDAKTVLTPDELTFFNAMTAIESRKTEWLWGRVVAKDAVRLFLERTSHERFTYDETSIAVDRRGKPHVTGPWAARIEISIAHSKGIAAAVAWSASYGAAGLDLEYPRALSEALIDDTFSKTELELVNGPQNALALWCLKEAAAKATGEGTRHRLQDIKVESLTELRCASIRFSATRFAHRGATIAIARII